VAMQIFMWNWNFFSFESFPLRVNLRTCSNWKEHRSISLVHSDVNWQEWGDNEILTCNAHAPYKQMRVRGTPNQTEQVHHKSLTFNRA